MHASKLKNVGKLFSIEDVRGFEIFGLVLNVFTGPEDIVYTVLSDGAIYEIYLNEYKLKFYD